MFDHSDIRLWTENQKRLEAAALRDIDRQRRQDATRPIPSLWAWLARLPFAPGRSEGWGR
jgi:hypothetical protein